MINPNPTAARTIEASASELADLACTQFLQTQRAPAGIDMQDSWAHHFRQRVLELSAAVAAGEPALFTARVMWSRQAMKARYQESFALGDTLQSLRAVLSSELPPDSLSEALACIDEALGQYEKELPEFSVSLLDPGIATQRLALLYLQSALEGNVLEAMETIFDAIDDGLDPRDAITKVLLFAQIEVGHLWHLDQITIAEEHLVTTTTQRAMAVIADRTQRAPDRGKTAVCAAVASNPHDIGIRAIAYLLEMDGWRVVFLGPDVPRNDLPAAVHFFDADIALLSMALSSQLSRLQESIAAIRQSCGEHIRIMVGGNAFRDAPDIWQRIGADGFAQSAEEALRMAVQLTVDKRHH
ncbi:MAG: cobalamin-dependent protein [Gammaproteobacteria bacterium]|jgi:methanogenic corrinoid protein MtbC1|nr:cobalamin-dependent protein [Gammaproteobacteria bacterium]